MRFLAWSALLLAGFGPVCAQAQAPSSPLPDGPNRATVQRICSGCHAVSMFSGRRMTKEQWGGVVSNMIGRGAKISDEEYDQIVTYLGQTLPPGGQAVTGTNTGKAAPPKPKGLLDQVGPDD